MINKSAIYLGYTLAEILVVLMIVIILGGLGAYSFSGLRDTVLVKQNIEEIKQDLQLVQQKAMLLEKKSDEYWIYGVGIDFGGIKDGKYTYFKWCSPFAAFGDPMTRSEIIGYSSEIGNGKIGYLTPNNGANGLLPVDSQYLNQSFCDTANSKSLVSFPGMEEGKINAGFEMGLINDARYVVFESVTGRVFLYKDDGWPINYDENGTYNPEYVLGLAIVRNRGQVADIIKISSLSGAVKQYSINDRENAEFLSQIRTILNAQPKVNENPNSNPVVDPIGDETNPVADPVVDQTNPHLPKPVDTSDPNIIWVLPGDIKNKVILPYPPDTQTE